MKLLVCLIVVIGVRARPQGTVVSEVTTVADIIEITTQSGEKVLIENTDEIINNEDKVPKNTEASSKTTTSNGEEIFIFLVKAACMNHTWLHSQA